MNKNQPTNFLDHFKNLDQGIKFTVSVHSFTVSVHSFSSNMQKKKNRMLKMCKKLFSSSICNKIVTPFVNCCNENIFAVEIWGVKPTNCVFRLLYLWNGLINRLLLIRWSSVAKLYFAFKSKIFIGVLIRPNWSENRHETRHWHIYSENENHFSP